ncbi:MAG: biotin--[acetyl-CoA-carboxylase] ligase [bacterium]
MPSVISRVVGSHLLHLEEVASTSDLAAQMAEEGAPEGVVVVAERQTRGRGKHGRRWESPAGGLWTSIILRPPHPSSHAPIFTMMGAVASVEAIRATTGMKACVHWPNDLFLQGKKVGGILCEMRGTGRRIRYLIMGIGINVNQDHGDFSVPLRRCVTSLRLESGKTWDRKALAEVLYARLDFWYHSLQMEQVRPLLDRLGEVFEGPDTPWIGLREMLGIS